MSEPRTVQRAEYVTPKKSEEEIVEKAIGKIEQKQTPAEKQRQERIEQLVTHLMNGLNMTRACKEMDIVRSTGYEYWHQWEITEEAQYVNAEWWSLYHEVKKTNPSAALKMLTALKLRFHPEKFELKTETTLTENIHYTYTEEQRKTLVDARRIIRDKEGSASRPSSLH